MGNSRTSTTEWLRVAAWPGLILAGMFAWAGPAHASEDFDDVQTIIEPRLLVEHAQRIRLMIRQAVEGRLGPDQPGGRVNGITVPGLGVIAPAGADGATDPLWAVWTDGKYTRLESDDFGAEFTGHLASVGTGVDYALGESAILGVSFTYEKADNRNDIGDFAPGRLETDTVSFGPYLGLAMGDYFLFDASFVYSWADTDISDTISAGTYDSRIWVVTADLTAVLPLSDTLTLSPTVGVSYSRSRDEAYSDGLFAFPVQKIYSGIFNFGATLSYFIPLEGGMSIEPSIGVEAAWEFELFGRRPLAFGIASNTDDRKVDVTVTGAADIKLNDKASLSMTGSVGGFTRKQYFEISGGAQATIQF